MLYTKPFCRAAQAASEGFTVHRQARVLVGTWNVAEARPKLPSLRAWVGALANKADICAFGLQVAHSPPGGRLYVVRSGHDNSQGFGLHCLRLLPSMRLRRRYRRLRSLAQAASAALQPKSWLALGG